MPETRGIEQMPVAHRGLHGDGAPENSTAAIERAIQAGYAVEIDVRLSADGVAVVFHDEMLDRLTGELGPVGERPWDELARLELAGTASRMPRLEEVLDTVDAQTPLLVELKNWSSPGRLERRVREALSVYEGAAAVQSFNPRSVAWFRHHAPSIPRGQVSGRLDGVALERYKKVLLKRLIVNVVSRPDFVAYEHTALPYWPVALARRLGLPVLAWTVRSEAEHERVRPHVDNVIFEGFRP